MMMNSKPDDTTPSAASGVLVTVDVNSKPSAPTNLCADPERKMWWRSRPCLILAAITITAAIPHSTSAYILCCITIIPPRHVINVP